MNRPLGVYETLDESRMAIWAAQARVARARKAAQAYPGWARVTELHMARAALRAEMVRTRRWRS